MVRGALIRTAALLLLGLAMLGSTPRARAVVCNGGNDGASCDDGNACTQTDICQNGICVGSNPVTCSAIDQCHVAGTCNPSTGLCSNPIRSDGSACNDGNACTQNDFCQAGVCTGGNPITCTAQDQCHAAGSCNPATGVCSNPVRPDGTACSDGDACTQSDFCLSGVCVGSNPVTCSAIDQCHSNTCNPATGTCVNQVKPDGTSCSDGNSCTQNDVCLAGNCSGTAFVCAAPDQCHQAGSCNGDGSCSYANKPNGTACNDGDSNNVNDICNNGLCAGAAYKITRMSVAGTSLSVTFNTTANRQYSLESCNDVVGWAPVAGSAFIGDGKSRTSSVDITDNPTKYFVRVIVGP